MKNRIYKLLPLSLATIFSLTSCKFLANILSNVLVTAIMNSPLVLNGIDLLPEGADSQPGLIEWETLPTTEEARTGLEYFKNVLVTPKMFETSILDSPVRIDFQVTVTGEDEGAADNFKMIDVSKDDLPEGFEFDTSALPLPVNFALSVIVPVGDSDLFDNVNSFEDLQGLMETTSQQDLIEATNQVDREITLDIKAVAGTKEVNKSFFFNLTKPGFGQLILDEVYKSSYLINVYHEKTNSIESLLNLPTDSNNPLPLSYFRDSLAVPKRVELNDIGPVDFTVTVSRPELFFSAEMAKPIEEVDPGNTLITGDIEVYTFTPVGTYKDQIPNDVITIEDFSAHVRGIDARDLFSYVSQPDETFTLTIAATAGGETMSKDYFFTLEEPVIDEEIIDFLIEENGLLNVVGYESVEDDAEILSIANAARDENNPYVINHLVDTLVIPETIVLKDFGSRRLEIETEINDLTNYFSATKETVISENDVTARTITPLGTFDASGVPVGDLEALADSLKALPTKDLYSASQAATFEFSLDVTINLVDANENITESKSTSFYLQVEKPNLDEKIGEAIMNDYSIVNYIDHTNPNGSVANPVQPTDSNNPETIEYFRKTIIFPSSFSFNDFADKEITFEITTTGDEFFLISSKTHTYEGQDITVSTYSPVGTYDTTGITSFQELVDHVNNNLLAINAHNATEISRDVSFTVVAKINGVAVSERTYYFTFIPF